MGNNKKRASARNSFLYPTLAITGLAALFAPALVLAIHFANDQNKAVGANKAINTTSLAQEAPNTSVSTGTILASPSEDSQKINSFVTSVENGSAPNYVNVGSSTRHVITESSVTQDYYPNSEIKDGTYRVGGPNFDGPTHFRYTYKVEILDGLNSSTEFFYRKIQIDDNDYSEEYNQRVENFAINRYVSKNATFAVSLIKVAQVVDNGRNDWNSFEAWNDADGRDAQFPITSIISHSQSRFFLDSIFGNQKNYLQYILLYNFKFTVWYDGENVGGTSSQYNVTRPLIPFSKFDSARIFFSTRKDTVTTEPLQAKKLFLSPPNLPTPFTNNINLSVNEIAQKLELMRADGSLISQTAVTVESAVLRKTTTGSLEASIRFSAKFDASNNNYYESREIRVPVVLVGLQGLFSVSSFSSPQWNHLPSGDIAYHLTAPTTRLTINTNFVDALNAASNKSNLLSQFQADKSSWNVVNASDEEFIKEKIANFEITALNYAAAKGAYALYSRRTALEAYVALPALTDIIEANSWRLYTPSLADYYQVLRNYRFQIETSTGVRKAGAYADFEASTKSNLKIGDFKNFSYAVPSAYANRSNATSFANRLAITSVTSSLNFFKINNSSELPIVSIYINNRLSQLYDVNVEAASTANNQLTNSFNHYFFFQTRPLNIGQNISFIREDGALLDDKFIVKSGATNEIGKPGYVVARANLVFSDNHEELVTLIRQGGRWYSPRYKSNALELSNKFVESDVEYVFDQELQALVNPYSFELRPGNFDKTSRPAYTLTRVIDTNSTGVATVLEDWNDGRLSHTRDEAGNPLFDGIFGADFNGFLDPRGRLRNGGHKLLVEVANAPTTLENQFNVYIDKQPVKYTVEGLTRGLSKERIVDPQTKVEHELYFSPGEVKVTVNDIDLDETFIEILASNGLWYRLPANIKNIRENGQWKREATIVLDYQGFSRITIKDQAGNVAVIYVKQFVSDSAASPQIAFPANSQAFQDSGEAFNYQNAPLYYLTSSVAVGVLADPVVESFSVKRINFDGTTETTNSESFSESNWTEAIPNDYSFGKTLNSTNSPLRYAGDELSPFLSSSSNSWSVQNKALAFKANGLYEVTVNSRLVTTPQSKFYVFVDSANNAKPIVSGVKATDIEQVNFVETPSTKVGLAEGADAKGDFLPPTETETSYYAVAPAVEAWPFATKNLKISYSRLWQTRYLEVAGITDEGKYKIEFDDVMGNHRTELFLLLNKNKTASERLIPIATNLATAETVSTTAFWKGTVSFLDRSLVDGESFYEDADYAKWAWQKFLDDARKNGLTDEEAWNLYLRGRGDVNWDGQWNSLDEAKRTQWLNSYRGIDTPGGQFGSNTSVTSISSGNLIGAIVGGLFGGFLLVGGGSYLGFRSWRRRRINRSGASPQSVSQETNKPSSPSALNKAWQKLQSQFKKVVHKG